MSGRRRLLPILAIGLVGSQAGHLLAYQLRFGPAAQHLQSTGAHSYLPAVIKTSLGVTAALALTALFTLGLARVLSGRAIRRGSAPDYVRLVAALYTVQLAFFAGQEVGETLLAGMPVDSVTNLLLWGTLGQLPVAAVAAAGLRWLLVHLETAAAEIRIALAVTPGLEASPAVVVAVWIAPRRSSILDSVAGASLAKRGPPSSLRFSPS